ncbi:hypothetical protein RvY_17625 [Ramazzottius varieornatus]|uniref:Uncharacterized protein n=1 Tax=Ramazzottius varieornatus TaxID=947166 RepID=A0A1D1W6K2_RAMVA|nr:hypothetical protein RvY_17625 [Ramazzottius varieornatus]
MTRTCRSCRSRPFGNFDPRQGRSRDELRPGKSGRTNKRLLLAYQGVDGWGLFEHNIRKSREPQASNSYESVKTCIIGFCIYCDGVFQPKVRSRSVFSGRELSEYARVPLI